MSYISIRAFDNYIYANILLSRLQKEGFDCYLKDENTVTIDPLLSPAIGGIKLMVLEEDASRINALLDFIEIEYLSTIACPGCGNKTLQVIRKTHISSSFLGALVSQLINGSTRSEQRHYRCSNCGLKMDDIPAHPGE